MYSTGTMGNGLSPYRAVSNPPSGGMTLGPWVVEEIAAGWPEYDSVAVVERSFQTTSGSALRPNARAVTTSVRTCGPASLAAGIVPMFHVTAPSLTLAEPPPLSGVASRNRDEGGAAIDTLTFVAAVVIAFVTKIRKG